MLPKHENRPHAPKIPPKKKVGLEFKNVGMYIINISEVIEE